MFKYAVDGLTADPTGGTAVGTYIVLTPAALIVGYGAARAGAALCNELRNATFAKVGSSIIGNEVLLGGKLPRPRIVPATCHSVRAARAESTAPPANSTPKIVLATSHR